MSGSSSRSLFSRVKSATPMWIKSMALRRVIARSLKTSFAGKPAHIKSWNTDIEAYVSIGSRARVYNTRVGRHTYIGDGCHIENSVIGKFCSIAENVVIGLGSHPLGQFVSTHPLFHLRLPSRGFDFADRDYHNTKKTTVVGNDVWLGEGVLINDGIVIGDGAVVGAGAVVTKDVPPYGIVVGVPAKLLRWRFDEDSIERLRKLKWWDFDEQWLRENFRLFHNIDEFLGAMSAGGKASSASSMSSEAS